MGQRVLKDGKKRRRKELPEVVDHDGRLRDIPLLEEVECRMIDYLSDREEGSNPKHRNYAKFELKWRDLTLTFYVNRFSLTKDWIIQEAAARFASEVYGQHRVVSTLPIRKRTMTRAVIKVWSKKGAKAWDLVMEAVDAVALVNDVMST